MFNVSLLVTHMFSSEWGVIPRQETNKTVVPPNLLANVNPIVLMPQYPYSKSSLTEILQT